jgi:hypothetical protein
MAITSRVLRAAALSAAALLALSGCGGDDDPLKGKDKNTSANVTAPPLPPLPSEADERTAAGAEAFAKYYFTNVVNNAYAAGNLAGLVMYSHPECIVCRATVGDIATAWTRGRVDGGQVTVRSVKTSKFDENLTNVDLTYSTTRYVEIDGEGKTVFSSPAKLDLNLLLQLQWSNSKKIWQVREIVNQALRNDGKSSTASPTPSATP